MDVDVLGCEVRMHALYVVSAAKNTARMCVTENNSQEEIRCIFLIFWRMYLM